MFIPPSPIKMLPVEKLLWSEARKRTNRAISSALPSIIPIVSAPSFFDLFDKILKNNIMKRQKNVPIYFPKETTVLIIGLY